MAHGLTGLILAGGAGRRMGGMKPFARHEGLPLIAHAIARLAPQVGSLAINAGREDTALARRLAELGLPLVTDDPDLADLGPLSGVAAGLAALAPGQRLVTLPCDMPDAPADLAARLATAQTTGGAPAVYAMAGRDHPLCAIWTPALLAPLRTALAQARSAGGLRVMPFLSDAGALPLAFTDPAAFTNINHLPSGER